MIVISEWTGGRYVVFIYRLVRDGQETRLEFRRADEPDDDFRPVALRYGHAIARRLAELILCGQIPAGEVKSTIRRKSA